MRSLHFKTIRRSPSAPRDDDVGRTMTDEVGGSGGDHEVANAGNHRSNNGNPSLPLLLLRKFKLWAFRVANSGTGRTAVRSSTPQILRYQNNLRGPLPPTGTSCTHTHPQPAISTASNVESEYELPTRPENAIINLERVPLCTPPTFFRAPEVISNERYDCYECCSTGDEHRKQAEKRIMGLSKTQRIAILLAIDGVFFFIELIVGYAVHSLALVADAFHMLNDVLSLIVGLWAVKRAKTGRTTNYTYGWQRAETLGALFNGVFLLALCLSIFLQAIERFVEPRVVSNPVLVLVVGCLGLASNIMGLFLFHDHGHSHGSGEEEHEHGHSHSHDPISNAEEGHSHSDERVQWADESTRLLQDQRGNIEDVLPSVRVAGFQGSSERRGFSKSDETNTTVSHHEGTSVYRKRSASHSDNKHRRRTSFFTGTPDDMPIHPAGRRDEIINASHLDEEQSDGGTDEAVDSNEADSNNKKKTNNSTDGYGSMQSSGNHEYSHAAHKHRQPKDQKTGGGGHGHSHDDLNMRGVFLHVLGDALGNVGVIASALIIWLTTFPGRYYFDPAISLLIAFIILYSAIPLCKAAARILLQAVPMGMSIDEIRADIEDLKGINSAHHIHVWQLSDTKLVASLHVRISSEIKDAGTEGYMRLAREIQQCLKEYGIRSSTIQPEFEWDGTSEGQRANGKATAHDSPKPSTGSSDRNGSACKDQNPDARECMLDSEDAGEVAASLQRSESHAHDHNHDHDHDHGSHDHAHDHSNNKNKQNHTHQH